MSTLFDPGADVRTIAHSCSMLRYICLRNNWLSSASGLEHCPDVLEACFAGNFITSAVPLRHLFHLQRFVCGCCCEG